MISRFMLLVLDLHFTFACWGQLDGKISTMDFVQVLNGNHAEAIYYYENNWQALREKAINRGYIHSYQLLETPYSQEAPFDLMLVTTYANKEQYELSEKNFAELIAEKGGLRLLNDKKPTDFRKVLFNKTGVPRQKTSSKSTNDLSFLIGEWEVVRTYSPDSDKQRILKGTLVCETALDGQFIKCDYEMQRPNNIRGLDVVYFNYNKIYDLYESVWLSSTWPIKTILQGHLEKTSDHFTLSTSTQFKIENDVTEYVKSELIIGARQEIFNTFTRKTLIRTSAYEEGVWHHHMTETAKKINKK